MNIVGTTELRVVSPREVKGTTMNVSAEGAHEYEWDVFGFHSEEKNYEMSMVYVIEYMEGVVFENKVEE